MSAVESAIAALRRQEAKGLRKYGVSLEEAGPEVDRLDYAIQEAADLLIYLCDERRQRGER